jgi:hypothetical protein
MSVTVVTEKCHAIVTFSVTNEQRDIGGIDPLKGVYIPPPCHVLSLSRHCHDWRKDGL